MFTFRSQLKVFFNRLSDIRSPLVLQDPASLEFPPFLRVLCRQASLKRHLSYQGSSVFTPLPRSESALPLLG